MPVSGERPGVAKTPGSGVNDYSEALARLADGANVTPGEFEEAILLEAAGQRLTAECVTLDEIELFPTLAHFPDARRQHVAECRECARFLDAISPRDDEIEKFVESALAEGFSE